MRQAVVLGRIAGRRQDRADRPGHRRFVAVAAAAAIDRAGVHARAAANAVERAAEFVAAQDFAAAVVDQHDVHFAARPRAVKVRRIRRDRLAGRRTGQQPQEHAQVVRRAGISFSIPMQAMCSFGSETPRSALPSLVQTTKPPVSAMAKLTPVRPASACMNLSPQVLPGRFGQILADRSRPSRCAQMFVEQLADVLLLHVDRRQHDVAGRLAGAAARSARRGRCRPPRCRAVPGTD